MNSLKHETITSYLTRKKNKSHDIVRNMTLVCVRYFTTDFV